MHLICAVALAFIHVSPLFCRRRGCVCGDFIIGGLLLFFIMRFCRFLCVQMGEKATFFYLSLQGAKCRSIDVGWCYVLYVCGCLFSPLLKEIKLLSSFEWRVSFHIFPPSRRA